eukprot:GFYU01006474.1.p1 GENE.GFYU01006474.1~~GFYU01006474.1.p1  ORF type:complete len:244 (+),score=27.36 GFYU01006474.1:256-987(+)
MSHRSQSTSAFKHMQNTLHRLDATETIQSIAIALYAHICEGAKNKPAEDGPLAFYNETIHPMEENVSDQPPDLQQIYDYVHNLNTVLQLSAECNIICLIYVERLMVKAGLVLHPHTWRRTVIVSLLLGTKVWDEDEIWNADVIECLPQYKISDLNGLEWQTLQLLEFNTYIKSSLYAKYYFDLRTLMSRARKTFTLQPLNDRDLQKLEERSSGMVKETKSMTQRPSKGVRSMSHSILPSPSVL